MSSPLDTGHQDPHAARSEPAHDAVVERSTMVPAPPDEVLAALTDPAALSVWLGEWSGDDQTVRTDDGVVRRVTEHRVGADHVRWTWSPEHDPEDRSDVLLTITPAGLHTHLTVRESRRPAAAAGAATMSLAHPVEPTHRIEWIGELLTVAVWCLARPAALLAV